MGLLTRAATQICEYLKTRDKNPRISGGWQRLCQSRQSDVEDIDRQLEAGERPDPVQMVFDLPTAVAPEGQMHWGEEWTYPSQDLLLYVAQDGPYAGDRPENIPGEEPFLFEGQLLVCLEAEAQRLFVQIPLNPRPWYQPRLIWKKELEPLAKKECKRPRKTEQQWLAQFQQPPPDIGQRSWIVQTSEATTPKELLTNLVIIAEKESFPVSEEDRQVAWKWIHRVMRDGLRSWNIDNPTRTQLVKDFVGEVYEGLVKRFDLPNTDWTLRAFIQETALGLARSTIKTNLQQRGGVLEPEPLVDPISGEVERLAYAVEWVAQELEVSERTVCRWMDRNGFIKAPSGSRVLTAEQLAAFKQARMPTVIRQLLRARGLSLKTAQKRLQRWRERGLSTEDMAREARRCGRDERGDDDLPARP